MSLCKHFLYWLIDWLIDNLFGGDNNEIFTIFVIISLHCWLLIVAASNQHNLLLLCYSFVCIKKHPAAHKVPRMLAGTLFEDQRPQSCMCRVQ